MKYRKFWTLAFCVSLSCGASAQQASDDQSRALDALRQAETSAAAAPVVPAQEATPAVAPAPAPEPAPVAAPTPPPAPEPAAAAIPATPAPVQQAVTPEPVSSADTDASLQALRQAETTPTTPQPMPNVAPVPTVPPSATTVQAIPDNASGNPALDALRQQEAQPGLSRDQRDARIRQEKLDAMHRRQHGVQTPQAAPTTQVEQTIAQPMGAATPTPTAAPAEAPVAAVTPVPPNVSDTDAALQALRQAETTSAPPSAPVAPAAPVAEAAPAPAPAPSAPVAVTSVPAQPAPAPAWTPSTSQNSNASVEAAALDQALSGAAANQNPASTRDNAQSTVSSRVSALENQSQNPAATSVDASMANYVPVVPPGSAISAKEAKLSELLRRYNADEISPLQYHTERAKILAEP